MSAAGKRKALLVVGALVCVLAVAPAAPSSASHSAAPAPNTFSRLLPDFPKRYSGQYPYLPVIDPINRLIISFPRLMPGTADCFETRNIDTFELIKDACLGPKTETFPMSNSRMYSPLAAVDPADRLIFFKGAGSEGFPEDAAVQAVVDEQPGLANSLNLDSPPRVVLVSEDLKKVGRWELPNFLTIVRGDDPHDALYRIAGMSWYAPKKQLLVLTDYGWINPDKPETSFYTTQGVALTVYDVPKALALMSERLAAHPAYDGALSKEDVEGLTWTVKVPGCNWGLSPLYLTGNPYRGTLDPKAIHVPCVVHFEGLGLPRGIISKIILGDDGLPTGESETVPVPELPFREFVADPGSDRGYVVVKNALGTSLLTYDGVAGEFMGRITVDSPTSDDRKTDAPGNLGIDEQTGRLYWANSNSIRVMDGRRTPVSPGSVYPLDLNLPRSLEPGPRLFMTPVLPPTPDHPFRRFIAFTGQVAADTTEVTQDSDYLKDMDALNYSGPVPSGMELQSTYGVSAQGYGFHTPNLVNGIAGVVDNATYPAAKGNDLPLGPGGRSLTAAHLVSLSLEDGLATGYASALTDNSQTSGDLENSTVSPKQDRCIQTAPSLGINKTCRDEIPPELQQEQTSQQWPFPMAQCSSEAPNGVAEGVYTTSWEDGRYTQKPVEGSRDYAKATLNCAASGGSVIGRAYLGGLDYSPEPRFTISVGSAESWTQDLPPTKGRGATAIVRSSVKNVRIGVEGYGYLSIGEVTHEATAVATGKPKPDGGTTTTRTSTISNVSLWDAQGQRGLMLCSGAASCQKDFGDGFDEMAKQISHHFGEKLKILKPSPDPNRAAGSPGGYISAVQTNPVQMWGDRQIHGMSDAESTILPALRIVFINDGQASISRQIFDLAGVQAEAKMGFLPPDQSAPPEDLIPTSGSENQSGGSAQASSGTEAYWEPDIRLDTGGGLISFISSPGQTLTKVIQGIARFFAKVLSGIKTALRSPAQMAQMFALLTVLGIPAVLMRRRRTWLMDLIGG